MASTHKTFGDFFDEVREAERIEGGVCEKWKGQLAFQKHWWIAFRKVGITKEVITIFASEMVIMFRDDVTAKGDSRLYTIEGWHDFLKRVRVVADRFDIDVGYIIDAVIAPALAQTEAVAAN